MPTKWTSDLSGEDFKPQLIHRPQGLTLKTNKGDLRIDFVKDHLNYLRPLKKGKSEIFSRAIGVNRGLKRILDVTAGLAQDAAVLARLGCEVQAVERNKWIFPLLEDAKKRAIKAQRAEKLEQLDWIHHVDFIFIEARQFLLQLQSKEKPQVIYLDPMFPEKKKSALPRKEMQIFRAVVGEDEDASDLLRLAMKTALQRVVVKRPLRAAELLSGVSHRFEGSSVRYDMYLTNGE